MVRLLENKIETKMELSHNFLLYNAKKINR